MLWTFRRGAHALSTTADSVTIDVPAGRTLVLHSLEAVGLESAAAAANQLGIYEVTTLGNGAASSLTISAWGPNPDNYAVPTGLTAKHGYATQPVLGALRYTLEWQPLGGSRRLPMIEPLEFWKSVAYQVSFRPIAGNQQAQLQALFELK